MDMNTIESTIHTTDPGRWRPGDAWLAGGTVLFSYGSSVLRRLLDISAAGWTSVTVTADGLELAATCTIAELYALPESAETAEVAGQPNLPATWPGLDLVRPCCDAFVASFKIWNMSTVGGNLCTALPAGPMTSLTAALDGTARIWTVDGGTRVVAVEELVVGDGVTSLAPGELLRSITLPAAALRAQTAFRRLSLSNLGRSGVLLIGRRDDDGGFVLTVTAATKRPVKLRFAPSSTGLTDGGGMRDGGGVPTADGLRAALDAAIPQSLYHDDIHGLPAWRRDMTYRLAEEIRAELLPPGNNLDGITAITSDGDRPAGNGPAGTRQEGA
ncbi:FAD binding domain-containing protein [Paenarthrobacter sp. PH39-S1]|uniref:FAD binding domain-containing protein n=1 Tax=Paenarthrobacter sp. PH39-S1 TaxID=3046204 RepID=UPI0024B93780|nr:FAD binding domain-containing protein [Paenarthrobacter sp. PH39-S1]MDJ0356232.1 FAD binding domain-containing protein [Paenarthrobacter sp. PH39-S1]